MLLINGTISTFLINNAEDIVVFLAWKVSNSANFLLLILQQNNEVSKWKTLITNSFLYLEQKMISIE